MKMYPPQVIENRIFVSEAIPIDESICEEWEEIENTGVGFFEFAKKYALLEIVSPKVILYEYGPDAIPVSIDEDDYCGIRDMLDYALDLRYLLTRGNVTADELNSRGIYVSADGKTAKVELPVRGRAYLRFLFHSFPLQGLRTPQFEIYEWPGKEYSSFSLLQRLFEGYCLPSDLKANRFVMRLLIMRRQQSDEGSSDECYDGLAERVLDTLCKIHLNEVSTVTNKGVPYQAARWGINALWLAYCNKFTHSRIARCKACGRSILVTEERGTRREYCDERCRSWKRRHPGQTRELRASLKERLAQ